MPGGVSRRGVLVGIVAGVAGCLGDGNGTATETSDDNPFLAEVTEEGALSLSSPAFEGGGRIPQRYGRDGENVNPPLSIRGVPEEAESLAVVLDDPDAPGGVFLHWLVWNVDPRRTTIPEGWEPEDATEDTNDPRPVRLGVESRGRPRDGRGRSRGGATRRPIRSLRGLNSSAAYSGPCRRLRSTRRRSGSARGVDEKTGGTRKWATGR